MRKTLIFILIFTFSINAKAQKLSESTVDGVYKNIVFSIGNVNPRAPKLILKDSERNPASYNPNKKTITIENKVLEICYAFGPDSLNALSYILAHELGHHYRHHGWMAQYASLDFSRTLESQNRTPGQRQVYETEADIYAGFYAHIAGYDALKVADVFLDSIYESYSLPPELENYPTLSERKSIINNNKEQFEKYKNIFDVANIVMSVGNYSYAQELFQYIIDKGFTSREIYNNLGLCYVYEALSLDVEESLLNVIIPFKIDISSRLESKGTTRGAVTDGQKAISLFQDAKREFKTALQLDPNYSLAKENIYYSNIALSHLGEKQQLEIENLLVLENVCEFCIKGHKHVIDNHLNKAKSCFKKGSNTCHICAINLDLKSSQIPPKKKKVSTVFDDLISNGVDMYCHDFKAPDCDLYEKLAVSSLCVEQLSNLKLIKLKRKIQGKSSCIGIQEICIRDDQLINSENIYVDDSIDKIIDNHQNLRIITSSNRKYISILNTPLTFLIEDDRVLKWYYIEQLK